MYTALREKATIKTGGIIEIHTASLPVGAQVEVIVLVESPDVAGNALGWPEDFFARFAGCLPDFPVRESEGAYEIRLEDWEA